MSGYLLDTGAAIALTRGRNPRAEAAFARALAAGEPVLLSTIVLFELHVGIARSAAPARHRKVLEGFLEAPLGMAPFEEADAVEAALVRVTLERAGRGIGACDTLIAGQARRRALTFVTGNRREFDRVPGLAVADWSEG